MSTVSAFEVNNHNRDDLLDWLNNRRHFHTWFTSRIVGRFVVLTVFGNRPGYQNIGALFSFGLACAAAVFDSLQPGTRVIGSCMDVPGCDRSGHQCTHDEEELAIVARAGVIAFVSGLTFGFAGNLPA